MSTDPNMFADEFEPDPFNVSQPVLFPDRGTHSPSWYVKHTNPRNTMVTQGFQPIDPGFFVSEVAPERRWAIQENGEVLGELEFMRQHEIWWRESYTLKGQPAPEAALRPIPTARKFVSVRISKLYPEKVEPITRDPKDKPFVPLVQYDSDGNRPQAPMIEKPGGGYEVVGGEDVAKAVAEAKAKLGEADAEAQAEAGPEMVRARCGALVEKKRHGAHVRYGGTVDPETGKPGKCEECARIAAEEKLHGGK